MPAAQADISFFTAPAFRGQPGTDSAYWDSFTSAYNGANIPNGVAPGGGTIANATITQTVSPSAFLISGGNIYDFGVATGFILNGSAGFDIGQVVFQTRTLGSTLDYDSVLLTYDSGSGPASLASARIALADAAGGDSSSWTWDLSALGNVSSFSIGFNASSSSMSFDTAMLDVAVVPEPGTLTLLALGGLGLALARRSRLDVPLGQP